MRCLICFSADGKLLKLEKDADNNFFKQITCVLPDFAIPKETRDSVYICARCPQEIASFYSIKKLSLENLDRLNHYKDLIKDNNMRDFQFSDLKIKINSEKEVCVKRELDIVGKIKTNFKRLLSLKIQDVPTHIKEENNYSLHLENIKTEPKLKPIKKIFECTGCQKTFNSRSHLDRHSRVHTGERPYKCSTCQKRFTTFSSLKRHEITHTGQKPFKCDVCQKAFCRKCALLIHKRSHDNIRPYKCTLCDKTFTQSGTLSAHMFRHTGQKPYECLLCQYRCVTAKYLKIHILTHTDERAYMCIYCEKPFKTARLLTRHKKNIHNK